MESKYMPARNYLGDIGEENSKQRSQQEREKEIEKELYIVEGKEYLKWSGTFFFW